MFIVIVIILSILVYKVSLVIQTKELDKENKELELLSEQINQKKIDINKSVDNVKEKSEVEKKKYYNQIKELKQKIENYESKIVYLENKEVEKLLKISELKQIYINPSDLNKYYAYINDNIYTDFQVELTKNLDSYLYKIYKRDSVFNKFYLESSNLVKLFNGNKDYEEIFSQIKSGIELSDIYLLRDIEKEKMKLIINSFLQEFKLDQKIYNAFYNIILNNLDKLLSIFEEVELILQKQKEKRYIKIIVNQKKSKIIESIKQLKFLKNIELIIVEDHKILDGLIIEDQFYRFDLTLLKGIKNFETKIIDGGIKIG